LYELLTGWTPYFSEAGELTEILFKLFTAEPHPIQSVRPDLPPALCEVIHKCLARDLDTRPSSAAEMAELLAPFADDRSKFVLDRIRHPPPPRKTAPPPASASSAAEGIEAFHKMSVGGSLPSMGDRKSIGEAATQISVPPDTSASSAPPAPAAPAPAASMARDAAPMMKAAASAQGELDETRNSAMTATQALAEPASSSRFSPWLVFAGVGAVAIGIAVYATSRHATTPLDKDPSATTPLTATSPTPSQTEAAGSPSAGTTAAGAVSANTAPSASTSAPAAASQTAHAHPPTFTNPRNSAASPTSSTGGGTDAPQNSGIHQLNDIGRKR
ncbi:MAG: hypothetical protein ACREJX_05575, partial [Polyangiaceae bacterium]